MRLSALRCGALLLLLLTVSRQHFAKLTREKSALSRHLHALTVAEGRDHKCTGKEVSGPSLWDLWSVSSPRQSREPQGSVSAVTRDVGGGRVLKQNKLFGELTAAKPL